MCAFFCHFYHQIFKENFLSFKVELTDTYYTPHRGKMQAFWIFSLFFSDFIVKLRFFLFFFGKI